jgi:hypothetical protein
MSVEICSSFYNGRNDASAAVSIIGENDPLNASLDLKRICRRASWSNLINRSIPYRMAELVW